MNYIALNERLPLHLLASSFTGFGLASSFLGFGRLASSFMGYTTTEITGLAEKEGVSAKVIAEGGWDHVLVYNAGWTSEAFVIRFVSEERKCVEGWGRAPRGEVDTRIPAMVFMRVAGPVRK